VHFRNLDELPYVMTLIRQSYQKQMNWIMRDKK
jgi:predicted transport protein